MEPSTRVRSSGRSRLGVDLAILALVGMLLVSALWSGGAVLYRQFYSPSAFVEDYLSLLASGRAADALRLPGVAVDRDFLDEVGIDPTASDALLRSTALAPLTEIEVTGEQTDGDVTDVTVAYRANGVPGTSTFAVRQDGWIGIVPRWRFDHSPLAAMRLELRGADEFTVNGFEVLRGQVSVAGGEADPRDPLPLLVFTPGYYSVTVDTPISASPGVSMLADAPLSATPIEVQATATAEFVEIVQQRVEEFLTQCTTQHVLQPTACPFGFEVRNRIEGEPVWSIARQPTIAVEPDGVDWRIPATEATAHIDVDIRSLFDGSIQHVSQDVAFEVNGSISILPDGSASIRVGSPVPAG